MIELALRTFSGFYIALLIISKEKKSECGTFLEFFVLAVSFRGDGGHVIASCLLDAEKIQKFAELVGELAD